MVIDVTEETSLQALYRLAQEEPCMHPMPCFMATWLGFDNLLPPSSRCQEVGPIVLLNFASAKNPGGAKRYKLWGRFVWESAAREV